MEAGSSCLWISRVAYPLLGESYHWQNTQGRTMVSAVEEEDICLGNRTQHFNILGTLLWREPFWEKYLKVNLSFNGNKKIIRV